MKNCESSVTLYVADNPQGMEELAGAREILARLKSEDPDGKYGRLEMEIKNVNEEDWSNAWKKYYHPIRVGERLVVCPSWEEYERQPEDVVLTLNPGMAFGTGTHDTTRLCMELLEKYITPEVHVLDVGCGSGILSIAALRLGAEHAVAVDIDPKAVDVAYENAALNGVGRDRYTVRAGDILTDRKLEAELGGEKYPLVLANIVADVIIPLSAWVPQVLSRDGVFLCSGIIAPRAQEVADALARNGLKVTKKREKNGWAALEAVLA